LNIKGPEKLSTILCSKNFIVSNISQYSISLNKSTILKKCHKLLTTSKTVGKNMSQRNETFCVYINPNASSFCEKGRFL
jgi:hypothetical protein